MRFLNCLGPCGERDVVGLRDGENTTWLGAVDDTTLDAAVAWAHSGQANPALHAHALDPTEHDFTPDIEISGTDRPLP